MRMVTLTPDMAADILKSKTRKDWVRNDDTVEYLANLMRTGEWIPDKDPIALSNTLIRSGHHRLAAIVEAGIPVEVQIWDTYD